MTTEQIPQHHSRDWSEFDLTQPPLNGDPVQSWIADVLWVMLKKTTVATAERAELGRHADECLTVKRVDSLWNWGSWTLKFLGGGAIIIGILAAWHKLF